MMPTVYRPVAPGVDLMMLRYHPFVTWKTVVVEKVLPLLPDIPVMKLFKRAALVAILGVGLAVIAPGNALVHSVRAALANVLQKAATAISP